MVKKAIIIVVISLFAFACSENSSPVKNEYSDAGKSALLIFVENNDGIINSDFEFAFQLYKEPLLDIFAEIYGISKSDMNDMHLNDIIETYGETWQINHIKQFAVGHYDTILTFRNESATYRNMIAYLTELNSMSNTVDVVFCLHGNEEYVAFYDDDCYIDVFANFAVMNKLNLRMLYQTSCYAGKVLSKWQKSGLKAVNGAIGLNNITLFSPGFFMEEWVNGATFEDAVHRAFERDIAKITSYEDKVPVVQYILTKENLAESKQYVAGADKRIKIKNYLNAARD